MTEKLTYTKIMEDKTGKLIPVFLDGRAMYSLYNSQKDADSFANDAKIADAGFIVIFGLGNGCHIKSVRQKNAAAKIVVCEHSHENLDFLKTHFHAELSELTADKNVIFCAIENLAATIFANHVAALDGEIAALFQSAWNNAHTDDAPKIKAVLQKVDEGIKSDAATQKHFGKKWHKNIFANLETAAAMRNENRTPLIPAFGQTGEALIVAAGPSLDKAFDTAIGTGGNKKIIICVDTALPVLLKKNIVPDVVVTIDGQFASTRHFMCLSSPIASPINRKNRKKMLLVADLCANPQIPRIFFEHGHRVLFAHNGHPLASLAGNIPRIDSGGGTVTSSALDFAKKCGLKKITVLGADFAYTFGKPYAKGTYFDDAFFCASSKINSAENAFSALMFRSNTKLIETRYGSALTTALLERYEKSFSAELQCFDSTEKGTQIDINPDYSEFAGFSAWYQKELQTALENVALNKPVDKAVLYSAIPLAMASLPEKPSGKLSVKEILQCAVDKCHTAHC